MTWVNVALSSKVFADIYLRAISQEMLTNLISEVFGDNTSHIPGANALNVFTFFSSHEAKFNDNKRK